MRILVLSPGQDTGGQGIRIKQAFDRHAGADWHVDAMRVSDNWIHYPTHLQWSEGTARELYAAADVVHHKNGMLAYPKLDQGQRKPAVLHHQGTRLRSHPREVSGEGVSVGAIQIVSTVDLLNDAPGARWLPTPYPLDAIRAKYRAPHRGTSIRIGHAPTNRNAKNSRAIMSACQELRKRYDIEVDLIEMVRWKVCLSRKGACDIFVDQVTLGYGNNAVEAWAMGIPVVSGFEDPADRALFVATTGCDGDAMPFYEANASNLVEKLEHLIVSRELRDEVAERGRYFAQAYHDERQVVDRLKVIYREAVQRPTMGVDALRLYQDRKVAI